MQTEEDPVYREKSLNQYMKAYKDTLKEEEVTEKQRKEEQLKGANVVTGKTSAPAGTGLGSTEITPAGVIPQTEASLNEKVNKYVVEDEEDVEDVEDVEDDKVSSQLKEANDDKIKIEEDLEQSKNNMKELQSKLETINQIYSELKK
jgi:galactokinase/mevalonate kinase-like predicted kinase